MGQFSGIWTQSQVSQGIKAGTWTNVPPSFVEFLVVAGGGGGSSAGGGAGGLLAGFSAVNFGSSITKKFLTLF